MALNYEHVAALGATIRDADKDAFGIRTDGNGNVVLDGESRFIADVLKLHYTYYVFADHNHSTHEQVFNRPNVTAMQEVGVRFVFDEASNAVSLNKSAEYYNGYADFLKTGIPAVQEIPDEKLASNPEYYRSAIYLKAAGITLVASDTRPNKDATIDRVNHVLIQLTAQGMAASLADVMLARAAVVNDAQVGTEMKAVFTEYFGDLNDYRANVQDPDREEETLLPRRIEDNRAYFLEVMNAYRCATKNEITKAERTHTTDSPAYTQAKERLALLNKIRSIVESDTPEAMTMKDVEDFHALIESFSLTPQAVEQALGVNTHLNKEQRQHNPIIAKNIREQSAGQQKVFLRWGHGHFNGKQDIDEYLGTDKTLVIMTVATKQELQEALARQLLHPNEDAADYIYMPAHKGEDGRFVPEQAVSAQEYIKAEQAKAAKREAPAPSHTR